jgi:hypothetical protein
VLDQLPAHCRPTIALVAQECAQFWHTVAERLRPGSAA